ncbi:MAG: hypothetical protein J6X62_01805 [Bacteroidales bacterium]|nr:hypothetical protein [Bacteroidales bacterium]
MNTIEQYIETGMSGKITRKRNSPLPSLLVLAVGIGLLTLLRLAEMGDSLMSTCLTVGMIATVLGVILTGMSLSGAMSHYVYLPTDSRMREKKVYIDGNSYKDAAAAIAKGNAQELSALQPVATSNYALNIVASRDGACALVQAERYDAGHFEPDSDVRPFIGPSAAVILQLIK